MIKCDFLAPTILLFYCKNVLTYKYAYSRYFSTEIHRLIDKLKKSFNLTWLRFRMSCHGFNNLAELLNGDLAAKIGRGIFSKDLMDRECNCSLPSKVNRKCVYKGKFR